MSLWHYAFVQQALVAGAVTAIVAGFVGPFVTARNMGFAVHGLAEVGFTGAAGAILVGLPAELGLLAACFAAALAIGVLGVRLRERDIAIGTILAFGLGLGVLFLSIFTTNGSGSGDNGAAGVRVLFGSIFGLSAADVRMSVILAAVAVVALAAMARPLLFASLDRSVAAAQGVPVRAVGLVFLGLVGLVAAQATQAVGALLLLGLLAAPAGAAHRLTTRPWAGVGLSALFALGSVWLGLSLAYVFPTLPPSTMVISAAVGIYAAAMTLPGLARLTRVKA